jgi:hypothetical protein
MMKAVSQHIFAKLLPFVAEHEIGKCNMQFRQAKLFTLPLQVQVKWCLYWPVSTAWCICWVSCEQSVVMHVMMELQCWFLTQGTHHSCSIKNMVICVSIFSAHFLVLNYMEGLQFILIFLFLLSLPAIKKKITGCDFKMLHVS